MMKPRQLIAALLLIGVVALAIYTGSQGTYEIMSEEQSDAFMMPIAYE